jgi:hypothetical protein
VRLAADLNDPSTELRERVRWTLSAQAPLSSDVAEAVEARDPDFAEALARRARGRGLFR